MPKKKANPNQEKMDLSSKPKFKFLKPKEKFQKYGKELKEKRKYTNAGELKLDANGKEIGLTEREIGFRQGSRAQYMENATIYLKKSGKWDESKASNRNNTHN